MSSPNSLENTIDQPINETVTTDSSVAAVEADGNSATNASANSAGASDATSGAEEASAVDSAGSVEQLSVNESPSEGIANAESETGTQTPAALIATEGGSEDESAGAEREDSSDDPESLAADGSADASLEIDQRRAKQLLDRALLLSDRGDLAGAILAARQAVALTPNEPTGHSVLGLLHERSGDLEKAIGSYERVLELVPQSPLERDSLQRLKETLASENSSVIFHFDDTELFEEPAPLPSANDKTRPVVDVAASTSVASASVAAAGTSSVLSSAAASSLPSVKTASPKAATVKSSSASPAAVAARPASKPVAGPPSVTPFDVNQPPRQAGLRQMTQHPSFFFKGVPVIVTTALGLLFVAWAQGVAQNRYLADLPPSVTPPTQLNPTVAENPSVPENNTPTETGGTTGTTSVNPTPPPQTVVTGGGVFGKGQPGQPDTGARAARPTTVVRSGEPNRPQPVAPLAAPPSSPAQPLSPGQTAPLIPQPSASNGDPAPATGSSGASPFDGMPPLRGRSGSEAPVRPAEAPVQPAQPAQPAPAAAGQSGTNGTSGSSSQGGLFNPSSQPRGYIRVDPVRPANTTPAAVRPSNQARIAENAASRASAAGQNSQVINNLNRAIDRAPSGYTYQRRAMAWLEANDYSRAAEDFQSAISAFEDQIRRGQNADDARNGITACRSGLQLALSNIRR